MDDMEPGTWIGVADRPVGAADGVGHQRPSGDGGDPHQHHQIEVLHHQHRIDRETKSDESERVGDEDDHLPGQAQTQDGGGGHRCVAADIADHQSGKNDRDDSGGVEAFGQHVGAVGEQDRQQHLDQMLLDPLDEPVDQCAERQADQGADSDHVAEGQQPRSDRDAIPAIRESPQQQDVDHHHQTIVEQRFALDDGGQAFLDALLAEDRQHTDRIGRADHRSQQQR